MRLSLEAQELRAEAAGKRAQAARESAQAAREEAQEKRERAAAEKKQARQARARTVLWIIAIAVALFGLVYASVIYDDEDSLLNGAVVGSQGISRVYLHRNGDHNVGAQLAYATSLRSLRGQASKRFGARIDNFFDAQGKQVASLDAVFDGSPLFAAIFGEAFVGPRGGCASGLCPPSAS